MNYVILFENNNNNNNNNVNKIIEINISGSFLVKFAELYLQFLEIETRKLKFLLEKYKK